MTSPPSGQTPAAWLARTAATVADRTAIRWEDGGLSFRELHTHSEALALGLTRQIPMDTTLAIRSETRWKTALALYACLRLGIPLLPLDPRLPPETRRRLCDLAAPCFPLSGQQLTGLLQGPEATGVPLPPLPSATAVHLLVPTSGSGGEPKIAMLTGANIAAAVRASRQRIPLEPGDRWLACLPLFHIGGLSILLRCLEAEATVLLYERFDAAAVWREITAGRVTHLSLVPAMLHRLLKEADGRPPPRALRTVLVGGAALDPGLALQAREAGWPLCVSYGMSEAGSQVATLCGAEAGIDPGRVGRPLAGFELRIAEPDHQGVGRIQLRGPALMAGYGAPGLMPGLGLVDGWLESGDLGRIDADGELWVLGRADDLLISGGENVHPARVEPVLQSCPGVTAAALSARNDPVWGDRLVAVYVGEVEPARLETHCKEQLGGAAQPREYLRLRSLPQGRSGKLDRRALRRLVSRGEIINS